MEHLLSSNNNKKESKSTSLNKILNELMANCDSLEAVIIADWQGLSFASKLPNGVNEDEISATTLFTLEGAEGTRKELEKSLLGDKLSYLIMVTEKDGKPAWMFVFPIEKLGYIASITRAREDIALIVQNMGIAAKKAAEILGTPQKAAPRESVEPLITSKYKALLQKLDDLKSVKLSFLDSELPKPESPQIEAVAPSTNSAPSAVPEMQAPLTAGPPPPPELPMEFLEVEAEEPLEPDILIRDDLTKFRVVFLDSRNIKYTVNVEAVDEFDVEVRLKQMEQYHPITILEINKYE